MGGRDDAEPSYDPRSWTRAAPPPESGERDPPQRAADAASPRRIRFGILSDQLAATGAGLAIAAIGAVVAYQARPDPARSPAAATAVAATDGPIDQRILNVSSADRVVASLKALGIAAADADAAGSMAVARLGTATGDMRIEVTMADADRGARLRGIVATRADGSGVAVDRTADGFVAKTISAQLVRSLTFVRGELDGESFYTSAVAAGVSDVLVGAFANAFRYDFDMQREVSPGDVFEAGFEQRVTASGAPVGSPTLVYAFLSTVTKTRALYRFQAPGTAEAEWYDSSGRSSRRALMRTPVEAARISSGFGMRGHPILGFVKMHRGTDFAAPTGTPIFAAGDAVVAFAGPKGANGNFVRLRHDNGWETLYLHMNRIAAGIAPGTRVLQGTQIGEVGTTGRSTGPHLHYEVHIAGAAVDPLSIETGGGRTIAGAAATQFRRIRDLIDTRRSTTL